MIENTSYYQNEALSNSKLKVIHDCPKRFYHHFIAKDVEFKETNNMKFGKAFHMYALEGEEVFNEFYQIIPKMRRNSTTYKELKAEIEAKGMVDIFDTEVQDIKGMVASLNEDDRVRTALQSGEAERELYWTDPKTGLKLKAKLDFINYDKGIILDFKKTASAGMFEFSSQCARLYYHMQAAIYMEACKQNGINVSHFVFCCAEEKAPYISSCPVASDDFLAQGHQKFRQALDIYQECLKANKWPGYTASFKEINLPSWACEPLNDSFIEGAA